MHRALERSLNWLVVCVYISEKGIGRTCPAITFNTKRHQPKRPKTAKKPKTKTLGSNRPESKIIGAQCMNVTINDCDLLTVCLRADVFASTYPLALFRCHLISFFSLLSFFHLLSKSTHTHTLAWLIDPKSAELLSSIILECKCIAVGINRNLSVEHEHRATAENWHG